MFNVVLTQDYINYFCFTVFLFLHWVGPHKKKTLLREGFKTKKMKWLDLSNAHLTPVSQAERFLLWLPREPTARENSNVKISKYIFDQFSRHFRKFRATFVFHFLTNFFSNNKLKMYSLQSQAGSWSIWGSPRGETVAFPASGSCTSSRPIRSLDLLDTNPLDQ